MSYVEYIKVGAGESWPVRDVTAQNSIATIEDTVAELETTLSTLEGKIDTNTSNISAANTNISTANNDIASLTTRVSTLETNTAGVLTAVWPSDYKGAEFPSNPTTGQIFLKQVIV